MSELPQGSPAPLPAAQPGRSVSIIVPTFREAENLPLLLARIDQVRTTHDLDVEVLVMDDDSQDGSVNAIEKFGAAWARIVVRTENRGLSPAVVDGLRMAQKEFLCVMDADLSHPPEKIPDMLVALQAGFQFVIGSRYVEGGSTDDDWGFFRWINSRIATLLALPLTRAKDPMAGFFAMRRADLDRAAALNPIGYKIGLELIVKCRFDNVVEVPIHFVDREFGESKLTLREQLKYLQHLRRLYTFKFGNWSHLLQFMAVGMSGVII
ncbi:MAG: polyprenol monophosphomannose synthase, partial [Myxococcota bacterium]